MRRILDAALVVADREVGVMVLAMRDPGERVDERHGLVIVGERVDLHQLAVLDAPALELLEELGGFPGVVRFDAAFAGLALFLRQFRHVASLSRAMRIAAGGWES